MNPKVIIYPKLPAKFHLIIRFMGSGLANCLFVYARAIILAKKANGVVINPTWVQFNIGPYIRMEKDKRHYFGVFIPFGITGFKKQILLMKGNYLEENIDVNKIDKGIIKVEGLRNYFEDLRNNSGFVKEHLLGILNKSDLEKYNSVNKCFIGVHIRLGDFPENIRTPMEWYIEIISNINSNFNNKFEFHVFSDGTQTELAEILDLPNTKRVFYGSAISDILILSKSKLIIASHSTFSAWGAYLGQVPILFHKKAFGEILDNQEMEWDFTKDDPIKIKNGISELLNKA